MPQKLCTWHSAEGSTSRAVQCSTTHLQLHGAHFCSTTPLASSRELCARRLCTQHGTIPKRLSTTNSWEGKAPRKPTGLQEYHTFKTDTECPCFHNELLAPLKQLCLKMFSTACHHWQRCRFDLKLFHSLGRNLMMQHPAAGFSGWFSFLNYKCPDSTETVPACLRDWLCLFSNQCWDCVRCRQGWWQAVGELLITPHHKAATS